MASLQAINPFSAEVVASYETADPQQQEQALARAASAVGPWGSRSVAERAEVLSAAAAVLRSRARSLAELMAVEMGKPVVQGEQEVEKCAWVCDYYAEHAQAFLQPQAVATEARHSFVAFRPVGVVLAVMPWNFPFWQVFRFAAPALAAGNVGLLKHASNVPGSSLAIASVFAEAGCPDGVFQSLLLPAARVPGLIADPRVAALTLTGSTEAGRAVGEAAGRAIKKLVLELGGSDAYVILEDAELELAVEACAVSRMINSGQSCIAAKRFIVVESVRAEFEARLVARMQRAVVGDPLDEATEVGPMARLDLRDELHGQVRRSVEAGARLLLGGQVPDGPAAFYPPTVLSGVTKDMPAFTEELFGPVAAIVSAPDEAAAIRLANDSPYGLGAAVFTRDLERGERIAEFELVAGTCAVNDFVRSDPRLPFGGVKESGYGRELSAFGIREFVNAKTIYVR